MFLLIPYKAYISLDAIIRTLYRVIFSKKKMLEWQTAESVEKNIENSFLGYIKKMYINLIFAVLLILCTGISNISALAISVLWLVSPIICYLSGIKNNKMPKDYLNENEKQEVRLLARKTWRYLAKLLTRQLKLHLYMTQLKPSFFSLK